MLRRETSPIHASPREVLLGVGLLLLAAVVCLEPAGSNLVEPDETRYAEISREMLASGDLVTPRLNGVPYFEKPPLLFWTNAISFEAFGRTAWAARLPSRLAALATAILLFWGIRRLWGTESGIAAGLFYLVSPLSFFLSRVDVTDGLLTFFFAATLFAARETIRRHEQGRPTFALSAVTGAAAAGAVLTKGAVGVLLPVLILCLWCVLTGRLRNLRPLLLGPAPVSFLLLCLPWFLLMEQRNPGFLHSFFVREHFLRFTTPLHQRDAPFFYFLLIFLGGFLAGLPFLGATARRLLRSWRQPRGWPEELFFLLWLIVVVGFFSFSRSKLSPDILPAFPAAAALASRVFAGGMAQLRAPWRIHALLVTVVLVAAAIHPSVRFEIAQSRITPLAGAAAVGLFAGAWGAYFLARRARQGALAAFAAGWVVFYAALTLAWPRTPYASEVHDLADIAKNTAQDQAAKLVFYRTMLYGVLWNLKTPVPVGDYRGELLPESCQLRCAEPEIFWEDRRFWRRWNSSQPTVAIVRDSNLQGFAPRGGTVAILARGRDHFLVSNFLAGPRRIRNLFTSTNLYTPAEGDAIVPLDQIPPRALARAYRESGGQRLVWGILEREQGRTVYEVVTSGRQPRAFEVSGNGDFIYVEEELAPRSLPEPVLARVSRVYPGVEIAYATREFRRSSGPDVVYEVYLRRGPIIREVEFDASGQPHGTEERVF